MLLVFLYKGDIANDLEVLTRRLGTNQTNRKKRSVADETENVDPTEAVVEKKVLQINYEIAGNSIEQRELVMRCER